MMVYTSMYRLVLGQSDHEILSLFEPVYSSVLLQNEWGCVFYRLCSANNIIKLNISLTRQGLGDNISIAYNSF